MAKTSEGKMRRGMFGDGRETAKNYWARETGQEEETKTKKKRRKKSLARMQRMINNS